MAYFGTLISWLKFSFYVMGITVVMSVVKVLSLLIPGFDSQYKKGRFHKMIYHDIPFDVNEMAGKPIGVSWAMYLGMLKRFRYYAFMSARLNCRAPEAEIVQVTRTAGSKKNGMRTTSVQKILRVGMPLVISFGSCS